MIENQKFNNFSYLISFNLYLKLLNFLNLGVILSIFVDIYYNSKFQTIKFSKSFLFFKTLFYFK